MISYVFGSSGFIGRHLVSRLKREGHKVIEVHHNESYKIEKADYIFYLSSYGNHIFQTDKLKTINTNIIDFYHLLKQTKDINCKIIHFSTSSVLLPVQTAYSESKFIAELMSEVYADKYNKNILSIRPYSVYGEGEAFFRFIPKAIISLKHGLTMPFSEGHHDWIYISDFLDALMEVKDMNLREPIGIGTGKQYSNSEIIRLLEGIAGKTIKMEKTEKRPYDTSKWVCDSPYISLTGWKPKIGITEGLARCFKYYE